MMAPAMAPPTAASAIVVKSVAVCIAAWYDDDRAPPARAGYTRPMSLPKAVWPAVDAEIALEIPPISPGIPWRLSTPHVSWMPAPFSRAGWTITYPTTDTMPATKPIRRDGQASTTRSLPLPIATPPASVAFWMSTIENLPPRRTNDMRKAPVVDEVIAITVLITTRFLAVPEASAPLNDGQNTNRNSVPTIAKVSVVRELVASPFVSAFFTSSADMNTRDAATPKTAPNRWMYIEPPMSTAWYSNTPIASFRPYTMISKMPITSSCVGPALPRRAPNEMSTVAAPKSPVTRLLGVTLMRSKKPWPLNALCQKPNTRIVHCSMKAAISMLNATAVSEYLRMNVIRKPKPMNTITWTSCQNGYRRAREKSAAPCSASLLCTTASSAYSTRKAYSRMMATWNPPKRAAVTGSSLVGILTQ
eukprot:Rhum_TRINITY_DN15381_c7_g1::Rhum_TRINITY_DN15381_c7_g1_i1::g.154758::m.154758